MGWVRVGRWLGVWRSVVAASAEDAESDEPVEEGEDGGGGGADIGEERGVEDGGGSDEFLGAEEAGGESFYTLNLLRA